MIEKPSISSKRAVKGCIFSLFAAALFMMGCDSMASDQPIRNDASVDGALSTPTDQALQPAASLATATAAVISPDPCAEWNVVSHTDQVIGVTLSAPARYQIQKDQYLSDEYGFIFLNSVGEPVVRVSWLHEATAADQAKLVGNMIESLPDISIQQTAVEVDGKAAVMLSPIPGEIVNTLLYVSADDRLYTLRFFRDELDAQGHCLLDSLRFETPTQSLASLDLTPIADTLHPPPPVETATSAMETTPQAPTDSGPADASPTSLVLPADDAEWQRHDFAEWGISLSMPADWKKERMPGFYSFTPPAGGNAQLTVGLQSDLPAEPAALPGALEAKWDGLTSTDFYIMPITIDDTDGLALWNSSPQLCADIYIPAHDIVRHINLGAIFCNETRDQLNEAGLMILERVEIAAPER